MTLACCHTLCRTWSTWCACCVHVDAMPCPACPACCHTLCRVMSRKHVYIWNLCRARSMSCHYSMLYICMLHTLHTLYVSGFLHTCVWVLLHVFVGFWVLCRARSVLCHLTYECCGPSLANRVMTFCKTPSVCDTLHVLHVAQVA